MAEEIPPQKEQTEQCKLQNLGEEEHKKRGIELSPVFKKIRNKGRYDIRAKSQ